MASSPCHVNVPKINYDVFISFRGADVRRGLLSHLKKELRRGKINAYADDRLERGDEILSSLERAIEGSQILLVIFSQDYASSRWCLEELVKMVECMERYKRTVIPIFYYVDPSDVRHQNEAYGAALTKHVEHFKENMYKVLSWKSALQKAAQLSGFHYPSSFQSESDLVDEIRRDVSNKLSKLCSSESNGLVGIYQNIAWIKSLLTTKIGEVLKLGSWGMGGVGKTTIAHVVFDTISPQYEGCCFLENVREELKRHQLCYLREKLVSKLLEKENPLTNGRSKTNCYTKRMLNRIKVLIVLDDVNNPSLLKDFLEPSHLGPKSRVIVGSFENDAYVKVFGKEHLRYVRGMGFGVCPSQLGSSSCSGGSIQSDGPSRAEHESLKLQLKLLQDQMTFFTSQQGGQFHIGFPTNQSPRNSNFTLQLLPPTTAASPQIRRRPSPQIRRRGARTNPEAPLRPSCSHQGPPQTKLFCEAPLRSSSSATKLLRDQAPATSSSDLQISLGDQAPVTKPRHLARHPPCSATPRPSPRTAMLRNPKTQIHRAPRPNDPDPSCSNRLWLTFGSKAFFGG